MTHLLHLLISWSVRRVLVFIVIVAAMVAFVKIVETYQRVPVLAAELQSLEKQELLAEGEIRRQRERAEAALNQIQALEEGALRQRLASVRASVATLQSAQAGGFGLALSAVRGEGNAVAREIAARFQLQLLRREETVIIARLEGIQRAAAGNEAARRIVALDTRIRELEQRIATIEREHPVLTRVERIPVIRRIQGPWRELMRARVELGAARAERQRLAAVYRTMRAAFDQARRSYASAHAAVRDLAAPTDALRQEIAERREQLASHWSSLVWHAVRPVLGWAVWVMLLVIVTPPAVKAFWFFALAPMAARIRPLRIGRTDSDVRWAARRAVGEEAGSAVSKRLLLHPGEELLVRPEYLQSSVAEAQAASQMLLSWRLPFGSLATGLVGLTRIRPTRETSAAISATRDMIDEVGIVEVEEGSSIVFRPRNLIGIVHRADEPVRLERVWALGHAMSWLTLQLRHLVFHGPCALVVKGARGIAIEPAAGGRRVAGGATMGWDAGLDYSVTRSETFLAYLSGKQSLFHDKFDGASGNVIYEEMPRARAKSSCSGVDWRGWETGSSRSSGFKHRMIVVPPFGFSAEGERSWPALVT